MTKRILIVFALIFCTILTVYYFNNIYGWMEFHTNTDTPDKFINRTIISKENYDKDKSNITIQLKNVLSRHQGFFYSKEYFEGTDIIIDTIIYSPDYQKLALLIITKNPTNRQLLPNASQLWYYNATSYLGVRQDDSIRLTWLGPIISNSEDKEKSALEIRNACFRTFVTKGTTESFAYKYNLNDSRFWDSDVWTRIEEARLKSIKFEKEKIENPENIYEPKDHK